MVGSCSEKKRLGFAQKTVSQKIPANWVEIAQVGALRISEQMKAAGVEVLFNANESFIPLKIGLWLLREVKESVVILRRMKRLAVQLWSPCNFSPRLW